MAARVAIIGAGISGLAAAYRLVEAGHDVRLYEASDRAGGVLGSHHELGFLLERAASSFVPAPRGAAELAAELGVAVEEASPAASKRWVFVDGSLHELPTGARALLRSDLLSWRGKLRAIVEPLQPTMPEAEESIADFCRRRLGSEVGRTLVGPLVTGIFAGDIENLSLRACFPNLAELEARGGLVRGAAANKIEQVFARLQGGQTTVDGRGIMAPSGGLEALVAALEGVLSKHISYETAIASLERTPSGNVVLHDAEGAHHECDALVLCTPAYVSASLIEPHAPDAASALRDIPYAPIAVVGLGYASPPNHALDGLGVLVAKGESPQMLGAVFESSLWPSRSPDGSTLIRCMLGGTRDPDVLDQSDEQMIETAKAGLETTLGIRDVPTFAKVVRWPRGIPQYSLGHLARVRRIKAGVSELGIVLSNNSLGGISVNECIAKSHKTAERVARHLAALSVLLLMVLALGTAACGGPNKPAQQPDDGGSAEHDSDSTGLARVSHEDEPELDEPVVDTALPENRGSIEIMARWLWPDSAYRRSPGRNACGVARPSAVRVELMGGLSDVAVSAESGDAPGAASIRVSACGLEPRVVVVGAGANLAVQNLDVDPAHVVVERMGAGGAEATVVGHMPLRAPGQEYALATESAGLLRLHTLRDPEEYAYALVTTGAAGVTSEHGFAELELEVGSHQLHLWHPPVAGKPLTAKATVDVKAQNRRKQIVDLSL